MGGRAVGTALSSATGTFSAWVTPPGVGAGQFALTVSCGAQLVAPLAVVASSSSTSPESEAALFGVFVLLGFVLLRGQFNTSGTRRRRRVDFDADE